jgi:two-component system, NarL family, response regulator
MTVERPIRILVADDHALMRLGIATLLRSKPDLEVVGEAADGVKAVTLFKQLLPDVLVLDLKMPGLDGVQVTVNICRDHPDAAILMLSHYDGEEHVFQALKAGARGYLTKEALGEELIEAVRTLHRGERYLPVALSMRLVDRLSQPSLTAREQQVLALMGEGMQNRAIGTKLGISYRTVGMYVGIILEKLQAATRTEAVAKASARGWLPPK